MRVFLYILTILFSNISFGQSGFYANSKTLNSVYFHGQDSILFMSKYGSDIIPASYTRCCDKITVLFAKETIDNWNSTLRYEKLTLITVKNEKTIIINEEKYRKKKKGYKQ